MSSFKNYIDIGVNRQNSGIDTASNVRLGKSFISRGSSNIYRSSYSSSGLNYGTGARNNGNIYCTTKNGHYLGDKIVDAHWERNRGIRKIQAVISTRNGSTTSKYSDSLFAGSPYPKSQQYRYNSSSMIDKSCTASSIPIKAHSSFSAAKYPTVSNTPSSISSAGGDSLHSSSRTRPENTESTDTRADFPSSQDSDSAVSSINVTKNPMECEDLRIPSTSRDSSSTSQFTAQSENSHAATNSAESFSKLSSKQMTRSDIVAMTSRDQEQHECTMDKHNEFSISSENKVPVSTSNSSLNSETFLNCSHASSSSNKSSTSNSACDSSESTRNSSQEILEYVDRECAKSSNSNYTRAQSEPSKMQATEQRDAQNANAQSDESFCSLSLSQPSFGSSANNCICKKSNDSSTHKSDASVSSGCNNSARSSRKLVRSSSSAAATELTALKIKSAATTTIAAAATSNSGGSGSSDSGSTSKSSSSSRSSCSNSSGSNISSDSNNSIRSQSASDASKSSNGKREIVPAVSPVSCSESVSSDVRNKKPPIPKSEMIRKKMSGPINKYVNKDFRKSALNMENGDASRSQITKKKYRQKSSKSPSLASQESQGNDSTSKHQLITDPSSQSFSSDGSSGNSSNENEEQNQPTYVCKTNISQKTNELGEMTSGAKQLVSSADERSINVNSLLRTRSGSSSKSGSFNNIDAKASSPMDSALSTASHPNKKSWCTAAYIEGKSKVSVTQSFTNGSQCANVNGNLSTNQNFGQTQHQYSDEAPWWLDPNSDNVPEGVERHPSAASDDISQDTTISTVLPDDGKFKFKIWRQGSEERCWWLDDNENNCTFSNNHLSSKNETTSPSPKSIDVQSKNSSLSKPSSPEVYWYRKNALKHEQSGERAWWLSDDPDNVPEGVDVIAVSSSISQNSQSKEISSNEQDIKQPHNRFSRLRHIDSGERPWWLDSSSKVPEGVEKISLSDSQSDDSSDSSSKLDCSDIQRPQPYEGIDTVDRGIRRLASFPLSDELLGDRTSPEGV